MLIPKHNHGMVLVWACILCAILAFISVEHMTQAHDMAKEMNLWGQRLNQYHAALDDCTAGKEAMGRTPVHLHWPADEFIQYVPMSCDMAFEWMRTPIQTHLIQYATQQIDTLPIIRLDSNVPATYLRIIDVNGRSVLKHVIASSHKVLYEQPWPFETVAHWRILDLKGSGYVDTVIAFLGDDTMVWMTWKNNRWIYQKISLPMSVPVSPIITLAPSIPTLRFSFHNGQTVVQFDCDLASGCHA